MTYSFAVELGLGNVEIGLIVVSVLGFLIMFGISSAKGDYQGLIKSTLAKDEAQRLKNK